MHSNMKLAAGLLLSSHALAGTLQHRQSSDNTAVVDLATRRGSPHHLAAGFIYGIPDPPASGNQIPSNFFTDMGFNYNRAGGAQLNAPCRGWIWGLDEYRCRFESTRSNYLTTREYGGNFIILPHDVWGTDHANSSTIWPGDNGDWTGYDQFLDQLISDIKADGMQANLVWDIWNEADGGFFGGRPQQQWIDLYIRTAKRLRSDPELDAMQISGPSHASQPTPDNTWWTNWMEQIKGKLTGFSSHSGQQLFSTSRDLLVRSRK